MVRTGQSNPYTLAGGPLPDTEDIGPLDRLIFLVDGVIGAVVFIVASGRVD